MSSQRMPGASGFTPESLYSPYLNNDLFWLPISFFMKARIGLGPSQAATSVEIKRLEDRLGYRLQNRTLRSVRLSTRGMTSKSY